jgi:hypothetical protein
LYDWNQHYKMSLFGYELLYDWNQHYKMSLTSFFFLCNLKWIIRLTEVRRHWKYPSKTPKRKKFKLQIKSNTGLGRLYDNVDSVELLCTLHHRHLWTFFILYIYGVFLCSFLHTTLFKIPRLEIENMHMVHVDSF